MKRRSLKLASATALVAGTLAAGALAYFTSPGSGSGTGAASVTLNAVTVTASTGTQSLLPTGSATGDVDVTLNNGNTSPIHIGSLTLDTSQGTSGFSANASNCALSFTTQSNGGTGWTIPASSSTASIDLTNSVTMGTSAASSCQGQTFTVYLKAS